MDKQALFHNLVQLAAVDGKFTEEEVQHLVQRAVQWGIPTEEFETALASLDEEVVLKIPVEQDGRLELMQQMIHLMAVDGELAETEKQLCATAAAKMEISGEDFSRLIDELLERNG